MSTEKLHPTGAWQVSDIIAGYLVRRIYYGYTRREAVAEFKAEFKPKRE